MEHPEIPHQGGMSAERRALGRFMREQRQRITSRLGLYGSQKAAERERLANLARDTAETMWTVRRDGDIERRGYGRSTGR